MKRNRIVINFDDKGATGARPREKSRGGLMRPLLIIAIIVVVVLSGLGIGGLFWWRHYQSSPAYSLALLVDATQRNDRQAIDEILDNDKIATDFVSQVRARIPASALWASQVDLSKMSMSGKVKDTLHDQLIKHLQELTDVAKGKPFVIIALAVPQFAGIKQETNTAHVAVNLKDEPLQLTMQLNGDRWRVIAVKDDKLANMIAQAMMTNLPATGSRVEDELKDEFNKLMGR
jgi:flagellar basal body-associated protein FliL